jgi:hypothetical protein
MAATVLHMADHRAIFVLPGPRSTVVFLASRGRQPRIAHERRFADAIEASAYAHDLSQRFRCTVVGPSDATGSGDALNG